MRNKLTLLGAIFALLLVGRIGSIGGLVKVPWWGVCVPLVLDLLFDVCREMDKHYQIIKSVLFWFKKRRIRKMIENEAKKIKSEI